MAVMLGLGEHGVDRRSESSMSTAWVASMGARDSSLERWPHAMRPVEGGSVEGATVRARGRSLRILACAVVTAALWTMQVALGAPPASAVLERCSGPLAVGPGLTDTMRVCIYWDTRTVQGRTYYYTNAGQPSHVIVYDVNVDRSGSSIGSLVCRAEDTTPGQRYECETNLLGNVAGNQAYVASAVDYYSGRRVHTPLIVA